MFKPQDFMVLFEKLCAFHAQTAKETGLDELTVAAMISYYVGGLAGAIDRGQEVSTEQSLLIQGSFDHGYMVHNTVEGEDDDEGLPN